MQKKDRVKMPAINDYSSRKEWEVAYWKNIVESGELLQLLITPHERHNIIMRAATLEGLSSGKSYKIIGEELWLSPQTISSIKKAAHEKSYRSYRDRGKSERKKKTYSTIKVPRNKPKRIFRRTKYGVLYMP